MRGLAADKGSIEEVTIDSVDPENGTVTVLVFFEWGSPTKLTLDGDDADRLRWAAEIVDSLIADSGGHRSPAPNPQGASEENHPPEQG